jgi:hypothetical protein
MANIGYRISSTLASQFFAIGLKATCVLPIVELVGVARYFAIDSLTWTGGAEGEMIVELRFDELALTDAAEDEGAVEDFAFRGEEKRLLNPPDCLTEVEGGTREVVELAATEGGRGGGWLCFSCSSLRMCGSRRMSRESENSKLGCSTLAGQQNTRQVGRDAHSENS